MSDEYEVVDVSEAGIDAFIPATESTACSACPFDDNTCQIDGCFAVQKTPDGDHIWASEEEIRLARDRFFSDKRKAEARAKKDAPVRIIEGPLDTAQARGRKA